MGLRAPERVGDIVDAVQDRAASIVGEGHDGERPIPQAVLIRDVLVVGQNGIEAGCDCRVEQIAVPHRRPTPRKAFRIEAVAAQGGDDLAWDALVDDDLHAASALAMAFDVSWSTATTSSRSSVS